MTETKGDILHLAGLVDLRYIVGTCMSKSLCIILYLQACAKTCDFVCSQLTSIQDSLDGKNLESVLTEFGTRFHRQLFEHLQQFQYTSIGKHYLFYRLVPLWLFFFCFSHFWVANQRLCLCGQQTVTKNAARVAEGEGAGVGMPLAMIASTPTPHVRNASCFRCSFLLAAVEWGN